MKITFPLCLLVLAASCASPGPSVGSSGSNPAAAPQSSSIAPASSPEGRVAQAMYEARKGEDWESLATTDGNISVHVETAGFVKSFHPKKGVGTFALAALTADVGNAGGKFVLYWVPASAAPERITELDLSADNFLVQTAGDEARLISIFTPSAAMIGEADAPSAKAVEYAVTRKGAKEKGKGREFSFTKVGLKKLERFRSKIAKGSSSFCSVSREGAVLEPCRK